MNISPKNLAWQATLSPSLDQRLKKNGDIALKRFPEILRVMDCPAALRFTLAGPPITLFGLPTEQFWRSYKKLGDRENDKYGHMLVIYQDCLLSCRDFIRQAQKYNHGRM
jgi:hypothetical protein